MSSRALANQEREFQTQRLTRLGRSLLLLLATALSFAAVSLLIADQLYRPAAFMIDQLKIQGKFRYLDPAQVEQVVRQKPLGNFFSVDLLEVKQRVESLAWVQHADVRREWPNTMLINITEHRPVMSWTNNDPSDQAATYWLTSSGSVVNLPGTIQVANPIKLSGNERDAQMMLMQTYQWKKLIEVYGLQLSGIKLSDSHAWQLRLSYLQNEFDLLLGHVDAEQRLVRFLFLFDSQFKESDQILTRVDARYPNGLAIRAETAMEKEQVALVDFGSVTPTKVENNR